MRSRHGCSAIGCDTLIPKPLLMCSMHWRMVPLPLKRRIRYHYRLCMHGMTFVPSREYLDLVLEARRVVNAPALALA